MTMMMMKRGLLTWSSRHRPHSLCHVSQSSLKTQKAFKPNSVFEISASINGSQPDAGGFTREDRVFEQSLLPKPNLRKWQSVLMLKNTITATSHLAYFHSTTTFSEKWKSKFTFDVKGDRQPPKNNIRYTVRQKRADPKKALKGVLFNGGCSTSKARVEADYADQLNKKSRIKPARQSKSAFHKKLKRKNRKENLFEDFDDGSENIFYAAFGKQGFSWTFRHSEKGFDWTENSGWSNNRFDEQDATSGTESHQESSVLGTFADRKILGLPSSGPLRIEDVKAAFRLSALKWHPDRHQGSSQAAAEEKFKQCVNAYKSICSTLSTP